MKNFLATVLQRKTRLWLYGICVAVTGYLGIRGIMDSEEVLYLNFVFLAIFGLAIVNVPSAASEDPPKTSIAANALDQDNAGVPDGLPQPPLW